MKLKNIMGLIIFGFIVLSFSIIDVSAASNCSKKAIYNKYRPVVTVDDRNISVRLNPVNDSDNDWTKAKFELTSSGFTDSNPDKKLTGKGNVKTYVYTGSGHNVEMNFKGSEHAGSCGNVTFTIKITGIQRTKTTEVEDDDDTDAADYYTDGGVNCDSPQNTFEKAFCDTRENAKTYTGAAKDEFKCDVKGVYKSEELKGNNYYRNYKALYKYEKTSETVGQYVYHFSIYPPSVRNNSTEYDKKKKSNWKTEDLKCNKVCEEAVEVKYGPPVASKAGLCFEYKVKVLSRVVCSAELNFTKPKRYEICNPYPICYSGSWTGRQGGPSEEFDQCIKDCDGGKYSSKCSTSCYNQVYGNSNKSTNGLQVNYESKEYNNAQYAVKLGNYILNSPDSYLSLKACAKANMRFKDDVYYKGCYYRNSYNEIHWFGLKEPMSVNSNIGYQNSEVYVPGKWYQIHSSWGLSGFSYYVPLNDGFYRAHEGESYCRDTCSWNGCSGDVYLNNVNYKADLQHNNKVYKEATEKCKAQASCSTSTAEFTISASYNNGTVKEEKFPYDSDHDYISSNEKKFLDDSSSKPDSTFINDYYYDDESKEPYEATARGCYTKNAGYTNRYRAAWSFPGTWVNLKTGEISYKTNMTGTVWKKRDKKFCLPLNVKSVNEKWWNYYYGNVSIPKSSLNDTNVKSNCASTASTSSISESDIEKWNIKANTKKFGYFDWDITISCFYAINNESMKKTATNNDDKLCKTCSGSDCYRIRSVNLSNLFPAKDGSTLGTGATGRTPGFNWSTYADTNNGKNNPDYLSTPESLIKSIQSKGDSIFNESSLDYQFYLSPEAIREMRSTVENSSNNYTNFKDSDFYIDDNGVQRYSSYKIRHINKATNVKIPAARSKQLTCNNMVNYNTTSCEQ